MTTLLQENKLLVSNLAYKNFFSKEEYDKISVFLFRKLQPLITGDSFTTKESYTASSLIVSSEVKITENASLYNDMFIANINENSEILAVEDFQDELLPNIMFTEAMNSSLRQNFKDTAAIDMNIRLASFFYYSFLINKLIEDKHERAIDLSDSDYYGNIRKLFEDKISYRFSYDTLIVGAFIDDDSIFNIKQDLEFETIDNQVLNSFVNCNFVSILASLEKTRLLILRDEPDFFNIKDMELSEEDLFFLKQHATMEENMEKSELTDEEKEQLDAIEEEIDSVKEDDINEES